MGPAHGLPTTAHGFVTTVGYDYEKDDRDWFNRVAGLIEHTGVAKTASVWVPRFGLGKNESAKLIVAALKARATGRLATAVQCAAEAEDVGSAEPQV